MRGRALALGGCIVVALFALVSVAAAQSANDPQIRVTPNTDQAFGELCIGATSASRTFRIDNEASGGDAQDLHVQLSVTGSDPSDFKTTAVSPSTIIPPGGHASFNASFSPTSRGSRSGNLRIQHDDPTKSTINVGVTGTGRDRQITADRATVSFGDQRVGSRSPTQTLIIRNPGMDTLHVSKVRRVGANSGDFRMSTPDQPFSILAGRYASITVAFQPTAAGLRTGAIEISSDACGKAKLTVSLVGTGVVSKVLVDPNPIDVGASAKDVQGPPTAVTVANGGGAPLKITAVQVLGTDAADFLLEGLPAMPATLPAGESFVFNVRMTASKEGARVAQIVVLSDDPTTPEFPVELRGTGGKASPSPTASASASASPSSSPKATISTKPRALGAAPNDSLAIILVIVAVLLAFVGLVVVRRFIAVPDDDE